jgi:hypothetical protein
MKKHIKLTLTFVLTGLIAAGAAWQLRAADSKDEEIIKDVMKKYHKAPKGVDTIGKKASDGHATPQELKDLVAAYKAIAAVKPPKGDEASWKEKTTKLVAAAEALQKGEADGAARYKEAVNCKACHSQHKPD